MVIEHDLAFVQLDRPQGHGHAPRQAAHGGLVRGDLIERGGPPRLPREARTDEPARRSSAFAPAMAVSSSATASTSTVGPGEVVAVLGRNGVGKSTLLKTILGLVPLVSGSVTFDGTTVSGWRPSRIARAGRRVRPPGTSALRRSQRSRQSPDRLDRPHGEDGRAECGHPGLLPDPRGSHASERGHAQRWGAADARGRPGAAGEAQAPHLRRTIRRYPAKHHRGAGTACCKRSRRTWGPRSCWWSRTSAWPVSLARRGYVIEGGAIVHEGLIDEITSDESLSRHVAFSRMAPPRT